MICMSMDETLVYSPCTLSFCVWPSLEGIIISQGAEFHIESQDTMSWIGIVFQCLFLLLAHTVCCRYVVLLQEEKIGL